MIKQEEEEVTGLRENTLVVVLKNANNHIKEDDG